jgi:hypothetical protein
MAALFALGRYDVVEKAHAFNLETMQPDAAGAAAHQAEQAVAVIPALGLSEQQREFIAAGMGLYYDLLSAIHAERQQNQGQLAEADCAAGPSTPLGSAGSQQEPGGTLESIGSRQQQLQAQQSLAQRLKLLLHKEYGLRLAVMGFFAGCLTYQQLSKLAVLSWPFAMRMLFLGTEIMQQWRQQHPAPQRQPPPPQHKQARQRKQRSV